MMAANYRHIRGLENRLGRHYTDFRPQRSLSFNNLPHKNRGTAGRIGEVRLIRTTAMSNGSCFFIVFLDRLFLVTAAHVYDGYMADKEKSGKTNIVCHIENIIFDPETRLRGYNRDLDIATFEFSYDDLIKMGKQAIPGSPWPPPEPIPELAIWFGGFPGL
jgi:hypothetical protein